MPFEIARRDTTVKDKEEGDDEENEEDLHPAKSASADPHSSFHLVVSVNALRKEHARHAVLGGY